MPKSARITLTTPSTVTKRIKPTVNKPDVVLKYVDPPHKIISQLNILIFGRYSNTHCSSCSTMHGCWPKSRVWNQICCRVRSLKQSLIKLPAFLNWVFRKGLFLNSRCRGTKRCANQKSQSLGNNRFELLTFSL